MLGVSMSTALLGGLLPQVMVKRGGYRWGRGHPNTISGPLPLNVECGCCALPYGRATTDTCILVGLTQVALAEGAALKSSVYEDDADKWVPYQSMPLMESLIKMLLECCLNL